MEKLTGGQDEVDLRLGHDVDEGLHQTRSFTLTEERRSCCNDGFGSRHVHSLEKEPCNVLDDPLHYADVIQHLHECNEEDDSGELE
jgi:hypothetical protein